MPVPANIFQPSYDSIVAKKVVDTLFAYINDCVNKDKKMNAFTRAIIVSQLPSIRDGTKEYLDEMNPAYVKNLLDTIQRDLSMRKK